MYILDVPCCIKVDTIHKYGTFIHDFMHICVRWQVYAFVSSFNQLYEVRFLNQIKLIYLASGAVRTAIKNNVRWHLNASCRLECQGSGWTKRQKR